MSKETTENETKESNKFEKLFGFKFKDLCKWQDFVNLMNRPEDTSCLAVFRILFGNIHLKLISLFKEYYLIKFLLGLVMMMDIPFERGMSEADTEYGTKKYCTFPLFDFLQPLPAELMVMVYFVMLLGKKIKSQ